ncbi:integrase catalytic domain-containing protein [Trichonephila clavipes]|nr:integrase catalytic domain-containing protein [Trichonephila clavipes]
MYKNALKEDLIRVVEELDGTVESTDTIVKLKTKIENSSTFESDPDFVKTLIQNCIDERVSQNEREVTSEQKIELAKLQLEKLEKEIELQLAKNKALSLNPAAKVEEKQFETNIENMIKSETYIQFAARLTANFQYYCSLRKVNSFESLCDLIISDKLFETLNKETATHIGIREAEDWFRPIDLAKECDIYISSRSGSHKEIPITYGYTQDPFKNRSQNFKPKIKENYPQYHERKIKIAIYAVIHLIAQETFLLWSPWKYRCGQRTVRMAVMACSQNQAVFARRRSELKLKLELVEEKQKLLDIRERKKNARGARAGVTF